MNCGYIKILWYQQSLHGSYIRISEYERLPASERNTTIKEKTIPYFPTQFNSFSFFLKRIERISTRQII
jgi:hypothetical protein